jgi:hypothetical protein
MTLPVDIFTEIFKFILIKFMDEVSKINYEKIKKINKKIDALKKEYIYPLSHSCSAAFTAFKLFENDTERYASFIYNIPIHSIYLKKQFLSISIDNISFDSVYLTKYVKKCVYEKRQKNKYYYESILLISLQNILNSHQPNYRYLLDSESFSGVQHNQITFAIRTCFTKFFIFIYKDIKIKIQFYGEITSSVSVKTDRNSFKFDDYSKNSPLWDSLKNINKYFKTYHTTTSKEISNKIINIFSEKLSENNIKFIENSTGTFNAPML